MKNIKKSQKLNLWFIVGFIVILLYPVYGGILDTKVRLSGVTAEATLEEPTNAGLMDGSYQSSLNAWVENNFNGRSFLIKVRSQLMYSLFNESPNKNVIIGKEKHLFEPHYICFEETIYSTAEQEIQCTIEKLEKLQELVNDKGKELYLFITPSKAHFNRDYIPSYYEIGANEENDYQKFSRLIQGRSLCCFDSHAYIENYNDGDLSAPVFYSTGIHWSYPWGYRSAKAFWELMDAHSRWDLAELSLTITEEETPSHPDTDLYDSLNLFAKPNVDKYYSAKFDVVKSGDKPNVFLRGGSFMGQSLSGLVNAGVFDQDTHFENNYYFTNQYTQSGTLSSFTAYDEMIVLKERLSNADIIILEVNEANIYKLGFGFVDYLLEHPDFLDYPEQET